MEFLSGLARQDRRTKAAMAVAAGWVVTLLYPPSVASYNGMILDCGYDYLFSTRGVANYLENGCIVNVGLLAFEWGAILAIGLCVWLWQSEKATP